MKLFSSSVDISKVFLVLISIIFIIFSFFRLYELEERATFSFDQVDNAWNAKNIIIEKSYPLVGMQARQNSGFFIGPAYYYIVAVFYGVTNLDPVASPILAYVISIFSFFVLCFVTSKLFSYRVALISCFIYAFSFFLIQFDRVQWPVALVPSLTLLTFFLLHRIILGREKYIFILSLVLGFFYHIHFSAVLVSIICIMTLPLFPRTLKILRYVLISSLPFFISFLPQVIHIFTTSAIYELRSYAYSSYHGFHLKRLFQIAPDAFLHIDSLHNIKIISARYFILPLFIIFSALEGLWNFKEIFKKKKPGVILRRIINNFENNYDFCSKMVIAYLFFLSFIVPWVFYSLYRGEISSYFFSISIMPSVIMTSYFLYRLFTKGMFGVIVVLVFMAWYAYFNMATFFSFRMQGLKYFKKNVEPKVINGETDQFLYGSADSYLHYFYSRKWKSKD